MEPHSLGDLATNNASHLLDSVRTLKEHKTGESGQGGSSSIAGCHLGTAPLRGRIELEGAMRTGGMYACMYV